VIAVLFAESSARGASLEELVPATIVAAVMVALVAAIVTAHRRGSTRLLARPGAFIEEKTGLPGWASAPMALTFLALAVAVFGYYWDVSWHIDRGRDTGAFANPAHWLIILGLEGVALAGVLALTLADERRTEASVSITRSWRAPVGGVLLMLCGMVALAGFPLDDIWHRLFGQDVTAWGPTHIQMIGGASLATLAVWMLGIEGRRFTRPGPLQSTRAVWLDNVLAGGAFMLGLSTLQVEFNFGVPQFRQVEHVVLLALAAGIGLVAVRVRGGRGTALGAAAFFVLIMGILSFVIAGPLGRSTMHFPLYLVEALIVEAVALRIPRTRQLTLGLWAGLGIGTIGFAAEWIWTQLWMPLPWQASLLPEAAFFALAAGISGGLLGGLIGRALAPPEVERQPVPRFAGALAALGAVACIGLALPMTTTSGWQATVTTEDVPGGSERQAFMTVQVSPADVGKDAHWFNVTSWQGRRTGDDGLVIADLRPTGTPGVYRTEQPVPLEGTWKTMLRLHQDRHLMSLPVWMPADSAIPVPEVPAPAPAVTRPFVRDKTVLQREAVGGSIGQQRAAYALLAVIGLAWIASMAWGLGRLDRASAPAGPRSSRPRPQPAFGRTAGA
jgi:hypothetical protein